MPGIRQEHDTPYLFTTSGRKVLSIKLEMLTRGVIKRDFDVRDIRRTFETYLASKKVDDKVRAHLFSHGIGGVQDEHSCLPGSRSRPPYWRAWGRVRRSTRRCRV